MFEKLDDTIVAISTPEGRGLRGIVRLSGSQAWPIAAAMFRSADGASVAGCPGQVRLCGHIAISADRFLLPGELLVFRAPRSYTRQDVAELHTAGAPAALVPRGRAGHAAAHNGVVCIGVVVHVPEPLQGEQARSMTGIVP